MRCRQRREGANCTLDISEGVLMGTGGGAGEVVRAGSQLLQTCQYLFQLGHTATLSRQLQL